MKKNTDVKPKRDYKMIAVMTAVTALFLVLGFIFSRNEKPIPVSPLPEDFSSKVNKLVINEVVTNNTGSYSNENGEICDYLEIYNGTAKTINLDGYGLSDRKDRIKWAFSNVQIGPNEYIVVSLTGKLEAGNNAAFKLSSKGGENLILTNPSGKVVDAVTTVALAKGSCMGRDESGQWTVYEYATPGFSNSQSGLQQYLSSLYSNEQPDVVINEFLVRNEGNFFNEDGQLDGFIEVKNISNRTVDLSRYGLSNDPQAPFKYRFDDIKLAPGEIKAVYCGNAGQDGQKHDYTGFSLSKKNGEVILTCSGKIIQAQSYQDLTNGFAMVRDESGRYEASPFVSAGFENDAKGIAAFQKKYLMMPEGLVINEVMNNNSSYLPQNSSHYYDWVELYNNSNKAILLSQYVLSNNDQQQYGYQLPEVSLEPGQYMVFMCSGNTALSNLSYYHTNFKISSEEAIYLMKDGKITDCLFVAEVPSDYSYGRYGNEGLFYFSKPTPAEANQPGSRTVTSAPGFLKTAGLYQNQSLSIEINGHGKIYYTTDGSIPTTKSHLYSGPISVSSTTVVKARAIDEDALMSDTSTATYFLNDSHDLPVLSVSVDPSSFRTMSENRYSTKQYQAHAEFFENGGGFSIDCSISLFGGNTRSHSKKSFTLRFDSQWGPGNLIYPVFENRDNSVYDALVLRTGSNDWDRAIIRDVLATSLVDEYTDVTVQAYKMCVLYINGRYWGIYNIREKVNQTFISDRYNVDPEKSNLFRIDGETKCGSSAGWKEVTAYAKSHDLSIDENYDYVASKVDIRNLVDYWICQAYTNNTDVYNIRFFSNSELDEGRWKYVYYDIDYGFRNVSINYYTRFLLNKNGMTGFIDNTYDNTLPRKLFDNEKFRQLWFERIYYNLTNTFSKENLNSRLQQLQQMMASEIERDRARWSETSMSNYNKQMGIIASFIEDRQQVFLKQTKDCFKLTDEQMKEYFRELW